MPGLPENSLIADAIFPILGYTDSQKNASTSRISFLLQSRGRPVPTGFWTNKNKGRRNTSAFFFSSPLMYNPPAFGDTPMGDHKGSPLQG